jgi:phage tail sheath protein FI
MPMSATTLSGDVDSSPVNVRRLLALLRRAAVRQGNVFAFEPNGDRLARNVQGTFTALLDGLYRRGAFAGATADASYRVVADATVNPPASVDQGRFVVELQVAPSLPLEFLTVRMVQQNGAATITEGRA